MFFFKCSCGSSGTSSSQISGEISWDIPPETQEVFRNCTHIITGKIPATIHEEIFEKEKKTLEVYFKKSFQISWQTFDDNWKNIENFQNGYVDKKNP